jgi:hypothetical protein
MSEHIDPGSTQAEPAGPASGDRIEGSASGRPGPLAPSEEERAASARARGLSAPYIAGGRDPEPDAGLREERFYGRLLLIMVGVIVLSGFVLGVLANLITIIGGGQP